MFVMNNKVKNTVIGLIVALVLGFNLSCSTSVPQKEIGETQIEEIYSDELKINVKKAFCWINAMPGIEKPRFHVSGEVEVLDNSNYDFREMEIKKVTVIQDKKMVFMFTPEVVENVMDNKKSFTFSTIRGLLLNAGLDKKNSVNLLMNFNDGYEDQEYIIENVSIELAL